jgi:prepilin-type N-terminal cleavage/methylation domain-containing protein
MNKLHNLTIPTTRTRPEKGDRTSEAIEQAGRLNKRSDRTSHVVAIEQLEHSLLARRGFTLIEVLVASAIFVVSIGIAIATFSSSSVIQMQNQTLREVTRTGMYVMESVDRDIRLANGWPAYDDDEAKPQFTVSSDGNDVTMYYHNDGTMSWSRYRYEEDSDTGRGTIYYSTDLYPTESDLLEKSVSIAPVEGEVSIFELDPYDSATVVQPNLGIAFIISNLPSEQRKAQQASETLQSTITTRSYPGFD